MREWLVALSASLTLAFSAWGLGGIPTWSLHVLFAGGVLTLALALFPYPRVFHSPFSTLHFPLRSLKRLVSWPPFYFSLAFLVYLLVGALNPGAEVVSDERGWWVRAVQAPLGIHLPTSVRSDYEPMNAWRVFASFTASFTLMWGVWAGVSHRKVILLILWMFMLSGAGMGFVANMQHITDAKEVLWHFPSSNLNFWGSFFYRNQSVAYLNLILVSSGVLFFYHALKTREHGRNGGPHFLCILIFGLVVTSVALALSRGGIVFASILTVCFLLFGFVYMLQGVIELRSLRGAMIPILILGIGSFATIRYVDIDAIDKRFGDVESMLANTDQNDRVITTKATLEMAQDRPWFGWGAGSFRYVFPMYQRNYPEIHYSSWLRWEGRKGRQIYRYAHNDLVQFVAEYGIIGCGLLVLTFASMVAPLVFKLNLFPYSLLFLLAGMACASAHAFIDFIFNSPAYWLAFVGLIAGVVKLLDLEARRVRVFRSDSRKRIVSPS